MVAIQLNANYIFVESMQSRSKEEMIWAYEKIINMAGFGLKNHTLDNEASESFKQCILEQQIQYKLVTPGNHQHNQAERTIQTFKAHFISILASIDEKFPLSLWCHLLEPTELTLNLLCQSKVAPKMSAFAHVNGPHNYMKKTFHLWAVQSKPTSNRRTAAHGTHIQTLGLALARRSNTTGVSGCT
jgi:hypothetical protein